MTTILPVDRPIRYCITGLETPIIGQTLVGDLTGVNPQLDVVASADESAFWGALPAALFPPLPSSGWLEQDAIYQYNGQAVIVRQSHNRTEHDPADVPALFLVYREGANTRLPWIADEQVWKGTLRTYEDVTYETVIPHGTQSDYTPDRTPNLWRVWVDPNDEPQPWVQPTGAHDAYRIDALVTHVGLVWRNTVDYNVYEPGVHGWVKVT